MRMPCALKPDSGNQGDNPDGEDINRFPVPASQTGYYNVDLELKDSGVDKIRRGDRYLVGHHIGYSDEVSTLYQDNHQYHEVLYRGRLQPGEAKALD